MYVLGGYSPEEGYLDDLYALQLSSECFSLSVLNRYFVHIRDAARRWYKFHNVGPSPGRRAYHAMVSVETRVFVLGAYIGSALPDEVSLIHVFDTSVYFLPVISSSQPLRVKTQRTSSTRSPRITL